MMDKAIIRVDGRMDQRAVEAKVREEKEARPGMRLRRVWSERRNPLDYWIDLVLEFEPAPPELPAPEARAQTQWEEGLC